MQPLSSDLRDTLDAFSGSDHMRYPCPRTVYFIYVSVLCVLLTPTTSTQQNPLDHSTGFITGVPSCHLLSPLHGTARVRVMTCDSVPDTFLLEILQRLPIALRIKTKSFINLPSYRACRVPPVSSDTMPPSAMVWVPSLGLLSEPQTCHVPFRLMSCAFACTDLTTTTLTFA